MRTKFSKLLSILLCLVMVAGMLPTVALAEGEGTNEEIGSLEQLKAFRDAVNAGNNYQGKTVTLTANIDMNEEEWTPIGTSSNPFNGTFDGGGYTISNLVVTGNNSEVGLFGRTNSGEVKNLTVKNAKVSGYLNVGVVAGTPYTSKYTNISVTGHVEVNGFAYVGGVGGKNAYADWTDITVDVDDTSYVKATSTDKNTAIRYRTYVGGVIGFNGEGGHTFQNISSNIDVIGDVCDVGGIFGIAHYSNNFEKITCSGDVTNTNSTDSLEDTETGGICGVWHNQAGTSVSFDDCKFTGTVTVNGVVVTSNKLTGGAYNPDNDEDENSGSLIVDNEKVWPLVAEIDGVQFGTLQAAIDAAVDGDTITLLCNINFDEKNAFVNDTWYDGIKYTGDQSFTIDLNGKTISCNEDINDYLLYFINKGEKANEITLKNGTVNGGKNLWTVITVGAMSAAHPTILNLGDNLTVNGDGSGNGGEDAVVKSRYGSTVNVLNGAKVISDDALYCIAAGTNSDDNTAIVNIYDGATVTMNKNNGAAVIGTGILNIYGGTINSDGWAVYTCTTGTPVFTISGGTITGATGAVAAAAAYDQDPNAAPTVIITGGQINGNISENHYGSGDAADLTVSGGTFNVDPTAYLADGYWAPKSSADNLYYASVDPGVIMVAQLSNGVKYRSLLSAIEAAKNGDTVTLLKDVDLGSNTLKINKKITLDGGAEKHSITSTVGGAVVDINTSERVTIQNLKIFATASGKTGRGIGISNTSAKIDVKNVEIEATQRGITVNTNANDGIVLNVEDSMISLVEPGKTAAEYDYSKTVLSTNVYNNSRGISLWEMANSKVTLKNTTVQGFYYSINNSSNDAATKSEGLVVSAEGCTFKGRAAVNQHNAGVTYTLTNCNITGINNFGGEYEAFACIVMDNGARDNHVTVNGGTVRASFNDTGSSNIKATQFLVADRVGNNTIELNNVTYICPTEYDDGKGGIVGEVSPGTEITVESGSYTMPEIIDTSYRNEAGEIGTLNILGGNFAYNTVSASIEDPDVQNALNISGGTFSSDPTAYVAGGYIAKKNSETEYAVIAKSGLTGGVYMSDPTDYTAANHYVTKNNDGTWTVFYVAPYVAPTYSITVDSAKHGDVTVSPRNASKGATVTITVESDKGYTLETLTVTDKDGDEIELTNKGDGKYTFTMPAGKVYVEATFMEDNSMLNFFVDVFPGDYYYDAVLWAAKNGITGGVDAAHFAPNATCTRAQVVTFLWRAAGSPAPKSSMMPFTDVPAGSYYETAVLWAAENGITGGTGNNAFSPDAACSRGQIVSFLWRALGSPAAGTVNPFTDVAADAYYNTAVLWAAENGITGGTGNNAFSPDADCTRAQIVTFLYRSAT